MKYYIFILLLFISFSCKEDNKSNTGSKEEVSKELLIYCENVLVPPLMELKAKFEKQWDCKINIHNDCSQNLASLVQFSMKGDIYLPASRSGFDKFNAINPPMIIDSVFIGYNPLVIMTSKDNPSHFDGNIKSLIEKKHALIIANPETSSLGTETQHLLKNMGLYDKVILNVVALSTDSRGLVKSIRKGEAQVVINWKNDIHNNSNSVYVELFTIPENELPPPEIYAGLLSTSTQTKLAQEFLAYASGEEGLSIFRKYGFNRRKTLIF